MEQRGRKSAANLSVVRPPAFAERPKPPKRLGEYATKVWQDVTAAKPGDWFDGGNVILLEAYCQHCHYADIVNKALEAFDVNRLSDSNGLADYNRLLLMQERETRLMTRLATCMRLTQQSKYAARTAARKDNGGRRPWEN